MKLFMAYAVVGDVGDDVVEMFSSYRCCPIGARILRLVPGDWPWVEFTFATQQDAWTWYNDVMGPGWPGIAEGFQAAQHNVCVHPH